MTHQDPSVHALGTALVDAVDATQELVLTQVELTKAEVRSELGRFSRGVAYLVMGATIYAFGHIVLSIAAAIALTRVMEPSLAVFTIGAPHALLGLAALGFAGRNLASAPPPEPR